MFLGFLFWIVFQLFLIIFVWREYREEGKKVLRGGGTEILCVLGGLWKIVELKGEGIKSGYRTKGLITWAKLAHIKEISLP